MGVTAFFYAAQGSLDDVEGALREVFAEEVGPLFRRERTEGSAVDAIYGNADDVQLILWEEPGYTVFAESELCLLEEEQLAKLSEACGNVFAACVGDHGGSYLFDVYQDGRLKRSLGTEVEPTGEVLAQEKGIDIEEFSLEALEALWSAFGFGNFYDGVAPFVVYGTEEVSKRKPRPLPTVNPARPQGPEGKRWWKFWE